MVIFPILDEHSHLVQPVPIWDTIEKSQKQNAGSYWLVTQPAHAALAGDLAAALRDDLFGPIDGTVSRSIALHDAGWSMDDAKQIQLLRSNPEQRPRSFLEASTAEALHAWNSSIDTVERFAPLGGYLVSRHFERLSHRDRKSDPKAKAFRTKEAQRQQRLRVHLKHDEKSLEKLVDALQFCDVLSLYLCSGSRHAVTIAGREITITRSGDEYKLDPTPFRGPCQFAFSALRHPLESGKKAKTGATFYVNL
jgi:hypothetical protein